MTATDEDGELRALEVLVGEWSMEPDFATGPSGEAGARVTFEWLAGRRFLVQRWSVPGPEAPDGIAVIGADPSRPGGFVQHYFDSRGVARRYRMRLEQRVWRLWRDEPDESPLEFRQRFVGSIGEDGRVIDGVWEICRDGEGFERDFGITYRKLDP
ncbi:MAG TPA: hypothetical protein VKW77_07655 [Acidimicrobiales bacterium]|nr:hypothetical protein [Acidimicrobiales bacterium]